MPKMSDRFVRRLERIRDEHQAASGALAYVSTFWLKSSLFNFPGLETVGAEEVLRAAGELEATYFIRLFSVFEGILKEHMAESHPGIRVAEDASAAWLIDRVSKLQRPPVSDIFRERVHGVRKYRNYLVHPGGNLPAFVQFSEALARLTRFADRLP
jgi:hypothetical protein